VTLKTVLSWSSRASLSKPNTNKAYFPAVDTAAKSTRHPAHDKVTEEHWAPAQFGDFHYVL